MLPLSILDLVPQSSAQSATEALAHSVALAQRAEALGYRRIWYAEHHSLPGVASTSPELMIAHVGARTSRIRLGAGGVMLPNHTTLRVAEAYRLLEAMHPGRVDLGIGRAPGTDQATAMALRGPSGAFRGELPEQLAELERWRLPGGAVVAQPEDAPLPPIWLLGSSDFSARLAAARGYPFAYAAHFSPSPPEPAMLGYRARFQPNAERLSAPRAMLALAVFCADSEEEARDIARPALIGFVRLRTGQLGRPPTREQARDVRFSPMEAAVAAQVEASRIVGTPEQVVERMAELAERTQADELILTTHVAEADARLKSAALVMEAWG